MIVNMKKALYWPKICPRKGSFLVLFNSGWNTELISETWDEFISKGHKKTGKRFRTGSMHQQASEITITYYSINSYKIEALLNNKASITINLLLLKASLKLLILQIQDCDGWETQTQPFQR